MKLETKGPTGSHKDRESCRIIRECRAVGAKAVGCASTGNFAVSLAVCARQHRMTCDVWLPSGRASSGAVPLLLAVGAELHLVDCALDELYRVSSVEMAARGLFDANPGVCALKVTANAQIGAEIAAQMPHVKTVVCCVNNGTHLIGVGDGLGRSAARLIGAFTHSRFASSISGFHGAEGHDRIEEAIRQRRGLLIEVRDDDLRRGWTALQADSVAAEVSSAAVVGALGALPLDAGEVVCCVVTSGGTWKTAEIEALLDSGSSAGSRL